MRKTLTFSLALVVGGLCLGCGRSAATSPSAVFKSPQVIQTFAAAGIRLIDQGPVLGTKTEGLSDVPLLTKKREQLVVEVFPTVRLAAYAQAIGGNIETNQGVPIRPLARVRNVLITLRPPVAQQMRQRALKAVERLRGLAPI